MLQDRGLCGSIGLQNPWLRFSLALFGLLESDDTYLRSGREAKYLAGSILILISRGDFWYLQP